MAYRVRLTNSTPRAIRAAYQRAASRAQYRRFSPPVKKKRRYCKEYGFGAVDVTVDPTKPPPQWLQTITQLAQQGLSVYQAERLRKENLDRIRAGQPPLTDAQMRALAPTANVNVALPQDLKWAMIGGGAFLLYLLAKRKR